jgi:hypothetical protein
MFRSIISDRIFSVLEPGVVVQACNPTTWEAEAGKFPAWVTKQDPVYIFFFLVLLGF